MLYSTPTLYLNSFTRVIFREKYEKFGRLIHKMNILDFFQKIKEETLSNSLFRTEISICTGTFTYNSYFFGCFCKK